MEQRHFGSREAHGAGLAHDTRGTPSRSEACLRMNARTIRAHTRAQTAAHVARRYQPDHAGHTSTRSAPKAVTLEKGRGAL
jgi:hypothetical protein